MNSLITVDYGISDWQIIPRKNNSASVVIGGRYEVKPHNEIYVRVIFENSGVPVTSWIKCDLIGDCEWRVVLNDLPEGGMYKLETINRTSDNQWIENGCRGQVVSNFGVGDIFFIAGQSNAAGTGLGTGEDSPMIGISNFKENTRWELATHPLKDRHSPFIAFAKKIYNQTGIPVGLCDFAVGGVPISQWVPQLDGKLYNQMVEVAKNNNIFPRAILFYQGCSDATEECGKYKQWLERFIENVRNDFKNEKLPVYTFQLNGHMDCREDWKVHDLHWDTVRESQRQVAKDYDNVFIIPTIDAVMSDGIHNSRSANIMLGERLANYVLKYTYNKGGFAIAPELESIFLTSSSTLNIKFKNVYSMIMTYHADGKHLPIKIRDDDGLIDIESFEECFDTIKIQLARNTKGMVYVSCQTGARNKRYIQDLGTNIPTLTFFDVQAVSYN